MNNIKCDIHNKFEFEVINGKSGKIREKATAYNIVTNKLWDYLITTTTSFATYIQYGSGSGTPSASDTSLFNRAGGVAVTEVSLDCDYANKVITRVCKIVLGLNDAVGVTLREVGMAAGSADGTLTTHAMLQDMNSNPISIAKTNTDIINIYATIYAHWSITDQSTRFHPGSGLQNGLTGRSNPFGSFTGGYGVNNWQISATKTFTKTSGDVSNKRIVYTSPRYSDTEANLNGGLTFLLGSGNFEGISIQKGNSGWNAFTINNESVGTGDGSTKKFKTKFSFASNATVYVNGVAQQSGVTVRNIPEHDNTYVLMIDGNSSPDNIIYYPRALSIVGGVSETSYTSYYYNPYYTEYGLTQVNYRVNAGYGADLIVSASNNLTEWTEIGRIISMSGMHTINIPAEYQNYKYWKIYTGYDNRTYPTVGNIQNNIDINNIVFDVAPSEGDVITITYDTDCIPKDSDHVLDATITFQFGEYNE